jgi:hypothetical protein
MKTFFLNTLAIAGLSVISISLSSAQETVSTGMVESVSPKEGTLTMLSDQTHGDLTLHGLERANIFTADGKALQIVDLAQGQRVTIAYAVHDKQWFISKVILSEPRPAVTNRNTTEKDVTRIREATEGTTRTPSADGKPDVAPQPATAPQTGTSISIPLRRTGP